MKKRYLLMTVMMGIVLLFGSVALAHEVSVFDSKENLIIRAYSSTPSTDQTCTPGPFCVNLEVRDPDNNGNLISLDKIMGLNDASGAPSTTNPLLVQNNATTDDLSLALDDITSTTFLFCKNGSFLVMQYNIVRAGAPTCTFTYSAWGTCQANGTQTRTATGSPTGCTGTPDQPLTQSCTPTCTSFTYSAWGTCVNGTQTRTITSSLPSGCSGGTPAALTQTCTTSGLPDLTVTGFSGVGSSYMVGSIYNITATVKNQGNASSGPFKIKGYLSASGLPEGQLLFTYSVTNLDAGASVSTGYIPVSPGSICAIHSFCFFVVKADPDNEVTESNETNNMRSVMSGRGR